MIFFCLVHLGVFHCSPKPFFPPDFLSFRSQQQRVRTHPALHHLWPLRLQGQFEKRRCCSSFGPASNTAPHQMSDPSNVICSCAGFEFDVGRRDDTKGGCRMRLTPTTGHPTSISISTPKKKKVGKKKSQMKPDSARLPRPCLFTCS